jgi:hypothetical protein
MFNKSREKIRVCVAERKRQELHKKIWRQLYSNASQNKKLEKEIPMKKVFKRHPRKRHNLGYSQVNYDLF